MTLSKEAVPVANVASRQNVPSDSLDSTDVPGSWDSSDAADSTDGVDSIEGVYKINISFRAGHNLLVSIIITLLE
jgi:hypothetical protein